VNLAPLAAAAVGSGVVFALGDDADVPGWWALVAGLAAAAAPPAWTLGAICVLGAGLPLLGDAAAGPLSVVDVVMLAVLGRAALRVARVRPRLTPVAAGAAAAVAAGAIATQAAPGDTAFLRVSTYLAVAVVAGLALERREMALVLRAFVGAAVGQALLALAGLTDTIPTGLPIGRYLGTYGDPGQFGLHVAAAAVLVAAAPRTVPVGPARWPLAAILGVALLGSNTRGAWMAALVAAIAILALAAEHRLPRPGHRLALGFALGVSLVVLAAAVTIAAPLLGLNSISTRIRIDSITETWDFFVRNPLAPQGLGNPPAQLPAYNTWLAVAVALSPFAAAGLLVFALGGMAAAGGGEPGQLGALVVFGSASMTENLVYGASAVTVSWFLLTGLSQSLAPRPRRGPARARPRPLPLVPPAVRP